jgi:hypothetical protein
MFFASPPRARLIIFLDFFMALIGLRLGATRDKIEKSRG